MGKGNGAPAGSPERLARFGRDAPILGRSAIVFLAIGILHLLLSGRAEGFGLGALKGLFLLALLPSAPLLLYLLVAGFWRALPGSSGAWLSATGIVVGWLFVFAGHYVTDWRVAETMERGEHLIELIESFSAETGAYPNSLETLAATGAALPQPALWDSAFHYAPDAEYGYRLGFPSVAFLYCSRTPAHVDWYCDD
jgi:hypothetical protein